MIGAARWVVPGLAVVCLVACADELGCKTEGAKRIHSVCRCPDGTRFVEDKRSKVSVCVAEDAGASTAADSGPATSAEGGVDAGVAGVDAGAAGVDAGADARLTDPRDAAMEADRSADVDGAPDARVSPEPVSDNACATPGQLRCVMPGAGTRQRCQSGRWAEAESCPTGQVCDSLSSGSAEVGCSVVLDVCKGNAEKPVCDDKMMQFCGKTGQALRSISCASKVQCELGIVRGACAPCLPGSYQCSGVTLEKCSADGQKFDPVLPACSSAALCNAEAGACTASACVAGSKTCKGDTLQTCNATLTGFDDATCGAGLCDRVGKQCDVCLPATKTCEGDSVKTCNAEGQGYTTAPCPSDRAICTSKGTCVQCTKTSDCPAVPECSVAMCNTASGSCASTFKAAGVACSAGICDGRGNCGPAPRCGDGVKNQVLEECDDGNATSEDDCLNNCKKAACRDGFWHKFGTDIEPCDPTFDGTSAWQCTPDCKKKTVYNSCSKNEDCNPGEKCAVGFDVCTQTCANLREFGGASGCPAALTPTVQYCHVYLEAICIVTGCRNDADCPIGNRCNPNTNSELPFVTACSNN